MIGPESELSLTTRAPLLAAEPVYAGQPIAVVAADTPEAARAGMRALALDLEVLAHVVDPQQARQRAALHGRARRTTRAATRRRRSPRPR